MSHGILAHMNTTHTEDMSEDILQRLAQAGAHFAQTKSRRHPSMRQYIVGSKERVDIVDLTKTREQLNKAISAMETFAREGKTLLFVGGKREVADIVRTVATRVNAPYVSTRWLGGTLTNFTEIKKRIDLLAKLADDSTSDEFEKKHTKLERIFIGREIERLTRRLDGLVGLSKLPDVLVVVDTRHEELAVREARSLGIPVVGIQNSDCDIADATHPIVANDASRATVKIILTELVSAYEKESSRS